MTLMVSSSQNNSISQELPNSTPKHTPGSTESPSQESLPLPLEVTKNLTTHEIPTQLTGGFQALQHLRQQQKCDSTVPQLAWREIFPASRTPPVSTDSTSITGGAGEQNLTPLPSFLTQAGKWPEQGTLQCENQRQEVTAASFGCHALRAQHTTREIFVDVLHGHTHT